MHLLSANVSGSQSLPANGTIELAFDRLLLPASITRQTFVLAGGNATPAPLPPLPSYDPVTRIVSITPLEPLIVGQTYELGFAAPSGPTDLTGLRAIDGAPLDPSQGPLAFMVSAPSSTSTPPTIDFCGSVQPIFGSCSGLGCHSLSLPSLPAAGLDLTDNTLLVQTAIGRVAHGSNTGPTAQAEPPGLAFGLDMPIIDPGTGGEGDPANSWLMYKLLLAKPPPGSPPAGPFPVQWQPLSDSERAILANYVPGREMPYPGAGDAGIAVPTADLADGLSTQQMETISLWIAQGATVPPSCAGTTPVDAGAGD